MSTATAHRFANRPDPDGTACESLVTDLYQLTMTSVYRARDLDRTAVFELFVRRLPDTRNFLVAAGLEQALEYLEHVAFSDDELDWLASTRRFDGWHSKRRRRFRSNGGTA
jgi:nicotinate phosphoribosyltransferase